MTRHVFIRYRRSDGPSVDELVQALGEAYPSWRDTARIRGGQRWREEIVRAIDSAYALILVVSPDTEHSKEVYGEYFYALGRHVPVIPLLIKQCGLPFGLENVNARLWYADPADTLRQLKADLDHYGQRAPVAEVLSDEQAFLKALQIDYLMNVENYTRMAGVVPAKHAVARRRWVMRPGIRVRRTSPLYEEQETAEEIRDHEDLLPALHELQRTVVLGDPGIGKTTTLYKFADELRDQALADDAQDGYTDARWWDSIPQSDAPALPSWPEANCPRETVSWYEAVAFCRWLSARLGSNIHLPTEWQWQQAASGDHPKNEFPWGPDWDSACCNSHENRLNRTTAVGLYRGGTWSGGPLDTAGNVWEWCLSRYDNPKAPDASTIDDSGGRRVVRGGYWYGQPWDVRSLTRINNHPASRDNTIGFRLAQDL